MGPGINLSTNKSITPALKTLSQKSGLISLWLKIVSIVCWTNFPVLTCSIRVFQSVIYWYIESNNEKKRSINSI